MAKAARRTGRNIVLTLAAMIVVALVLELSAFILFKSGVLIRTNRKAWVSFQHPYQPYLGWENPRGTTIRHTCCGGEQPWEIEIDVEGRSVTPHLNNQNPEVEIAIVGGSTMFGVCSVNNETTVPSLIEKELWDRTGVVVEVHNLAVSGYMSFQELLCLERFVEKHPVEIAIAISGYNDAYYAAFEDDWDVGLPVERITAMTNLIRSIEDDEMKLFYLGLNRLVEQMRQKSYAIDLFCKVGDKIAKRKTGGQQVVTGKVVLEREEIERRAGWTVTNYGLMDAMAKQNDIRFFMFLQPTAHSKRTLTDEEEQCLDALPQQDLTHYVPVERFFYDAARRHEKLFSFYDISNCLDDISEPAFLDDCHYREVAARAIAEAICDVIAPVVVEEAEKQ